MSLNNFLNNIEIDLRQALEGKAEIDKLLAIREAEKNRAEVIFRDATEKFREASILSSQFAQRIGELQGERFDNDESYEEWLQ